MGFETTAKVVPAKRAQVLRNLTVLNSAGTNCNNCLDDEPI